MVIIGSRERSSAGSARPHEHRVWQRARTTDARTSGGEIRVDLAQRRRSRKSRFDNSLRVVPIDRCRRAAGD